MPTPRQQPPPGARLLLEDGAVASGLGLVLLAAPTLFDNYSVLQTLALGFRLPGWLALGAGGLMLGYYALFQRPSTRHNRPPAASATPRPAPATQWGPTVLQAVEWQQFEAVCEALLAQVGFSPRALPRSHHQGDGQGVDIWLHSRHAEGPVGVLRCKQSPGKPVPPQALRGLQQTMAARGLRRGTFATASVLEPAARDFAKLYGIHVLDGPGLLQLIAKRTPGEQQALLAVAYAGEYWRPHCPACRHSMAEQPATAQRAAAWRCVPCKLRLPVRTQ